MKKRTAVGIAMSAVLLATTFACTRTTPHQRDLAEERGYYETHEGMRAGAEWDDFQRRRFENRPIEQDVLWERETHVIEQEVMQ